MPLAPFSVATGKSIACAIAFCPAVMMRRSLRSTMMGAAGGTMTREKLTALGDAIDTCLNYALVRSHSESPSHADLRHQNASHDSSALAG